MENTTRWSRIGAVVGASALALAGVQSTAYAGDMKDVKHVLLISFDGLHEQDVARCIGSNSCPNLAVLAKSGVTYTNAHTPHLSDSFPGLTALVTGGSPKSAGLFYDVSYDRTLYAPLDSKCAGPQGWNVVFDETTGIDGENGGALVHLDGGGAFNPQAIPFAKINGVCTPVYPHNYIKTNTVFEVIKQNIHGSRTAWSDKHAWGYDWVNGPSGKGVDDLARTEINSIDPKTGTDYTDTYTHTEVFDNIHVQALINQIDGLDSTGKTSASVPTLFGADFQTLSVAEKSPVSKQGGYLDANFGQNATKTGNLNDGSGLSGTGMVQTDDVGLIWLRDQSQKDAVVKTLKANLSCNAPGICADGPQAYILEGDSLADWFGNPSNGRTPDIIVQPNPGVIYTSSKKKDEEHGGNAPDDNHLGLVVSFPGLKHAGRTDDHHVFTTQVAPTILSALEVDPHLLHSVQVEGTHRLPGLGLDDDK